MSNSYRAELSIRALNEVAQLTPTPYAKGILGVARTIIEAINNSHETDLDVQRLEQRILEISIACAKAIQAQYDSKMNNLAMQVSALMEALEHLSASIQKRFKRGRVSKILSRPRDVASLKAAEEELEHAVSLFSLRLQMSNLELSAKEKDSNRQDERTQLEKSIAERQNEELTLIKSAIASKTSKARSQPRCIPPAPQIFFGRESTTDHLVRSLCSDIPSYAAILGPGGIGKTSQALTAMHDPQVISVYGQYRYFIACESIQDADGLIGAISDAFDIQEKALLTSLPSIIQLFASPVLLLLDNFETPWESQSNRAGTEKLLGQLSNIPNLSLLLTLRGAERPYGVPWTRPFLPPLDTMDLFSATQTFEAIADVQEEDRPFLRKLLDDIDRVPLAVTLMAAQAQFLNCESLLERWKREKTSMVARGFETRLSSLDVSIQISLDNDRLLRIPDATKLLRVLSLLPDGVGLDDLLHMLPPDLSLSLAALALRQVSLVQRDMNDRFHVLSPVREFIKARLPLDLTLFTPLFHFHSLLSRRAKDCEYTRERASMIKVIAPQIGNVHSVISHGIPEKSTAEDAIKAAVNISSFHNCTFIGSIRSLLEAALLASRDIDSRSLEAWCMFTLSGLKEFHARKPVLDKVLAIFRSLDDKEGIIQVLIDYGRYWRLSSRTDLAISALEEAMSIFTPNTPLEMQALANWRLADALWWEGSVKKAMEAARRVLNSPMAEQFPALAAACYLCLVQAYAKRSLYPQALYFGHKGLSLLEYADDAIGSSLLLRMGACFLTQSRLKESQAMIERACSVLAASGREHNLAVGQMTLGRIVQSRYDFEGAMTCFAVALHSNTVSKRKANQALSLCGVARVCFEQGNGATSWAHFSEARKLLRETNNIGGFPDLYTLFSMGDVLSSINRPDAALSYWIPAALICRKQSYRIGVAMGIVRIGDFFYSEPDGITTALACYEATLDLIRYLGVLRHIGECLLRLGMVNLRMGNTDRASKLFETGRKFAIQAEDDLVARYCAERLQASLHSTTSMPEDLPPLPPATTINA